MRAHLLRLFGALGLVALTLILTPTPVVDAQEIACPSGNLLLDASPLRAVGMRDKNLVTDGVVSREGDFWDNRLTSTMSASGYVIYDLGELTRIRGLVFQGDANDTYEVAISQDNKRYKPLWTVPNVATNTVHGTRTRITNQLNLVGRYIRVAQPKGDKYYSISEFQAFCDVDVWPPKVQVKKGKRRLTPGEERAQRQAFAKMILSTLAFLLIALGIIRVRRPSVRGPRPPTEFAKMRAALVRRLPAGAQNALQNLGAFFNNITRFIKRFWTLLEPLRRFIGGATFDEQQHRWSMVAVVIGTAAFCAVGWKTELLKAELSWIAVLWLVLMGRWFVEEVPQVAVKPWIPSIIALMMVLLLTNDSIGTIEIESTNVLITICLAVAVPWRHQGRTDWTYATLFLAISPLLYWGWAILIEANFRGPHAAGGKDVIQFQALEHAKTATLVIMCIAVALRVIEERMRTWTDAQAQGKNAWGTLWRRLKHLELFSSMRFFDRAGLLGLAIAGLLAVINLGTFHGTKVTHYWDTFHYVVGSKYFAENRYHLMYSCLALAERDEGLGHTHKDHKIRDLRTNKLRDANELVDEIEPICRNAFTEERWMALRQDVRLFRRAMGSQWYADSKHDHGYNASPVWTLLGTPISSYGWEDAVPPPELITAPAAMKTFSQAQKTQANERFSADFKVFEERIVTVINRIDFGIYVGMALLLMWAFGLRASALAMVIFGVGWPWDYMWTGGSFARLPWLFSIVAGVCFLRKRMMILGGFMLCLSFLFRVFPGALFGGPGWQVLWNLKNERKIAPRHLRFIIGAALAIAILIPSSLIVVDNFKAYPEFLANSLKHKNTPLTNHMGLPTLASFHPDALVRNTHDPSLYDPHQKWKDERHRLKAKRKIYYWATVLMIFVMLGFASRRMREWEAASMGVLMIISIFELTCYYYSFLLILGPFALRRIRYTFLMLGMVVMSHWIHIWLRPIDERYIAESALMFIIPLWLLIDYLLMPIDDPEEMNELERLGLIDDDTAPAAPSTDEAPAPATDAPAPA